MLQHEKYFSIADTIFLVLKVKIYKISCTNHYYIYHLPILMHIVHSYIVQLFCYKVPGLLQMEAILK